jgi:glutamate-1-semialdehyde 2,1-aminomutase
VAPYNQVPELDDETACVIVEPVAANMGLVPPQPDFLAGLRAECDRVGALLIFDEVITGFRVGRHGAQHLVGVTPDLTCLGKVIGGGLPVGAFGGRADVMDALAPAGPVYQAGTLSGNPLATAGGLAALDLLDDRVYATVARRADALASGLAKGFADAGVEAQVTRFETLVGVYFGATPPVDFDDACRTDEAMYARWFHGLLDRGIAVAPGAYEVLFPGLAHTDEILNGVIDVSREMSASLPVG